MDKVDQHPHTHHREEHTECDREVGDEGDLLGVVDGAEDEQTVQEGGDE